MQAFPEDFQVFIHYCLTFWKYHLATDLFAHFKYLCLQTFHFENACQVYMNTALPPTRAVLQILSTEFLASQTLLSVSRHGKKKSNKQNNLKKHYF